MNLKHQAEALPVTNEYSENAHSENEHKQLLNEKALCMVKIIQKAKYSVLFLMAMSACSINKQVENPSTNKANILGNNNATVVTKNKVSLPTKKIAPPTLQHEYKHKLSYNNSPDKSKNAPEKNMESNSNKQKDEIEDLKEIIVLIKKMYAECKVISAMLPYYFKQQKAEPLSAQWSKKIAESRKALNEMLTTLDSIIYRKPELAKHLVKMSHLIINLLEKFFNYPDIDPASDLSLPPNSIPKTRQGF